MIRLSFLALGLVAVACVISACGSDDSSKATAEARPKSTPPNFHQQLYDVELFNGWPQDENDKRVGSYLESAWHDPALLTTVIAIDARESDETGSPLAEAELARIQTNQLPDYRERGLKKIVLGGKPTVRWAFDVTGERRIDYFFEECGTDIVVRGTTPPGTFSSLSESFRSIASTIKVVCD
jgi:hypothetical protein